MKIKLPDHFIKRIIVASIGIPILAFGISLIIVSNLGSDPLNAFYEGLTKTFGLTIGTWTAICGVILALVAFILDKSKLGYSSVLFLVVSPFIIDSMIAAVNLPDNLIIKILCCLLGIFVTSIGCAFSISADVGLCVYDAFTFSIASKFKPKYYIIRWIIDGIFLIGALILKATIGLGTIFTLLLFGYTIGFCEKLLKKALLNFINK